MKESLDGVQWECPSCGYLNNEGEPGCKMCGTQWWQKKNSFVSDDENTTTLQQESQSTATLLSISPNSDVRPTLPPPPYALWSEEKEDEEPSSESEIATTEVAKSDIEENEATNKACEEKCTQYAEQVSALETSLEAMEAEMEMERMRCKERIEAMEALRAAEGGDGEQLKQQRDDAIKERDVAMAAIEALRVELEVSHNPNLRHVTYLTLYVEGLS